MYHRGHTVGDEDDIETIRFEIDDNSVFAVCSPGEGQGTQVHEVRRNTGDMQGFDHDIDHVFRYAQEKDSQFGGLPRHRLPGDGGLHLLRHRVGQPLRHAGQRARA